MSRSREIVRADFDATVFATSSRAVGFKLSDESTRWIPRTMLHRLAYEDMETSNIRKEKRVTAIEIPRWKANELSLSFSE